MGDRRLVLSIFPDEMAAETAISYLRVWHQVNNEVKLSAVGILELDDKGAIKTHRVRGHGFEKGAATGLVLAVLVPAAGLGVAAAGALLGILHDRDLGLTREERDHLVGRLLSGEAAVGVIVPNAGQAALVTRKLEELGGDTEAQVVSNEAFEQMTVTELPWPLPDRYEVTPGGYMRWLVRDRDNQHEVAAVERSYELALSQAAELNRHRPHGGSQQ